MMGVNSFTGQLSVNVSEPSQANQGKNEGYEGFFFILETNLSLEIIAGFDVFCVVVLEHFD